MSTFGGTLRSRILATSSAAVLSLALAGAAGGPAFAQDDDEEGGRTQDRIVVTGSRIIRQDFTANSPIVTVEEDLFENTTALSVDSILDQLPQFAPDVRGEFRTASVEPTSDQTPGTSNVNLRGLGAARTLVLIDGKRGQPSNASMAVDANSIPTSAIQRVEIISGGASAVYGADAVGGVVNFILRDNYEGVNVTARYGVTERGDGVNTQLTALFGSDFADGEGNVMFGAEISDRGNVLFADRDWMVQNADDPWVIAATGFGVTAPNLTSYLGTARPPGIRDPGGATTGNQPTQAAVDALFPQAVRCDPDGTGPLAAPATCPFDEYGRPLSVTRNQTFYINPSPTGQGTLFTSSPFVPGSAPGAYKYNGPTRLDGYGDCPFRDPLVDGTIVEYACYQELSGPLDRNSFFGRGRYEVNEALTLKARGNYATTYTRSILNPAGVNMIIPHGNTIWTGNAYSPSSLLANGNTHPDYRPGGRYGLNCPATGGCTQSQVFPLPPELVTLLASRPFPNEDVQLNSFLFWDNVRGSSTQTDIYQLEGGAEGDLGALLPWADDWFWDVSLSHGETHILNQFKGFASAERFRAVAQSPNFGVGFQAQGNAAFGGTGAGSANCTSGLPIIRDIEVTEDCMQAYRALLQNSSKLEQNVFEANLTGDIFDLPAGPLQFAVGTSYREDEFAFYTDPLNDLATFNDQPFGLFPKENSAGYLSATEVYGELLVPILRDLPFIESFSLELGGRLSDYDPTGEVETFKVLGDWEITDFMRLRGGWNRASRAPNLNELFAARAQTVAGVPANLQGDPCLLNNTTAQYTANPDSRLVNGVMTPYNVEGTAGAAHVQTVCRALMARDSIAGGRDATTGSSVYYGRAVADLPVSPGTIGTSVLKGNLSVQPETADTYTVGLVVNSPFPENPFLSGFSGSLDYFQIEIKDVIATTTPTALFQDCFSLAANPTADASRFSCSRIIRDPLDGDGLFLDHTYTNQGWVKMSGVDLNLTWRGDFADIGADFIPGGGGVSLLATVPVEQLTRQTATAPIIDAVGTQYVGLTNIGGASFEYDLLTTFNYFVGDLSASLSWEYTPPIEAAQYATATPRGETPFRGVIRGASLFNLNGSYRLNDVITLRAGVDNLLDKEPPPQGGNRQDTRFGCLPPQTTTCGGATGTDGVVNNDGIGVPPIRGIGGTAGTGSSGFGSGAYDTLGRRYFVGLTVSY